MSWNPTLQVIDLTGVVDNLLAYIAANQKDAHAWANGGDAMPDYAKLYPNATGRLATVFPQLIVLTQEHRAEELPDGDLVQIPLALTFEGAVTGKNADELVLTAKRYAHALESMLVNIPSTTLTGAAHTQKIGATYQTAFDILTGHGGKTAANWLQIFQTRCEFQLVASAIS